MRARERGDVAVVGRVDHVRCGKRERVAVRVAETYRRDALLTVEGDRRDADRLRGIDHMNARLGGDERCELGRRGLRREHIAECSVDLAEDSRLDFVAIRRNVEVPLVHHRVAEDPAEIVAFGDQRHVEPVARRRDSRDDPGRRTADNHERRRRCGGLRGTRRGAE